MSTDPDFVVHAPAAMMSSPVGDPVPMGPVPEKPLNPRWADRLYFWLGAEAERVVRRGEALKLRELFNRPTTRVMLNPAAIVDRNVLAPLPDDPVVDALPTSRSWPLPDDFWP